MGYGGFVRSVDLGKDYMLHSELYESVRVTDVKCGEGIQWRDCSYEVRTCHAPGAAVRCTPGRFTINYHVHTVSADSEHL